ncbi:MAG: GIY-YIG nuclease family protein [Lachnospiraceae bacterium]
MKHGPPADRSVQKRMKKQGKCVIIRIWLVNYHSMYWYQYMQSGKNVAAVRMEVSVKRKMENNRKEQKNNYVYMVCCADGSLYTGWTNDLEKRVRMHNAGKGAKYTKSRLPVTLVYHEMYEDRIQAMKREAAIKKLTRRDKLKLIEKRNRAGAETAAEP